MNSHKAKLNTIVKGLKQQIKARSKKPAPAPKTEEVRYYIGWKGAINNTQMGECDLAGGFTNKKYAMSILKDMSKLYKRGSVKLHTEPISTRMMKGN